MAIPSHKRETNARRLPKAHVAAGPIALLATVSTVALGVLATGSETPDDLVATSSASLLAPGDLERPQVLSRSTSRSDRPGAHFVRLPRVHGVDLSRAATLRAVRRADTELWTTADLNLWTSPARDGRKVGLLADTERVLVTGRETPDQVEVVVGGQARWVTAGYLAEEKPVAEARRGGNGPADADATCTNGSSVPAGVSPNIVAVHEAVCANFPEITSYGTFRGDGEHAQGLAVDIMVSGDRGWQVAEFLRANYSSLGISYLIYSQQIWSVDRGSEGWRGMEDRGSTTANHYDHVHVTTY